ncbi:MAG: hypothetical protein ACRDZ4_04735 [Egibacteraceae bacterium]
MPAVYVPRSQALPAADSDGKLTNARGLKYGELSSQAFMPQMHSLAGEGTLWAAREPTVPNNLPGTIVLQTGHTSFNDTRALAILANLASPESGIYLHLSALVIKLATISVALTQTDVVVAIDDAYRIFFADPHASMNVAMDYRSMTGGTFSHGAPALIQTSASASASRRFLYRSTVHNTAPVNGDTWVLDFDGKNARQSAALYVPLGPVVIGPGDSAVVNYWHNGTGSSTGEAYLSWWERAAP